MKSRLVLTRKQIMRVRAVGVFWTCIAMWLLMSLLFPSKHSLANVLFNRHPSLILFFGLFAYARSLFAFAKPTLYFELYRATLFNKGACNVRFIGLAFVTAFLVFMSLAASVTAPLWLQILIGCAWVFLFLPYASNSEVSASDDNHLNNTDDDDIVMGTNPASGLPMVSKYSDIAGNPYGFDLSGDSH